MIEFFFSSFFFQATLKDKSPNRWKGQQSKKRNPESNANSNNGHRGNSTSSYENRFKTGNRKDHWASARQHFLHDDDDNEEAQKEDLEAERRKRRKKKDESSIGGNGSLSASKTGTSISLEESKPKRVVPQKLPLKNIERPQSRSTPKNTGAKPTNVKSSKPQSNDIQAYWNMTETRQIEVTENGLNWEVEPKTNNRKSEAIDVTVVQTSIWSEKWRPPPDDVQPCSSKTLDPYTFA